ncbi:uncharacterized protein E6C27_scaffold270G00020 [Cucumis melo var. makuwa]|uniref:Uncharacterized protein n=2 Tax=Cucumis melo TaxID=3656 RepID=A0A5A7T599_CUCMM|nr:uncharacterized protein LOC103487192 [Cucumis melo]KAA0038173.1 uncharacterized protein E6C27_scaffold270G00020 [Cucumis melo var. makuwa]
MAPLLLLQGDELRKLAILVRNQEVDILGNLTFQSEQEQAKYLRNVGDNYHATLKLLDDADDIKQMFKDDETKSSIAHETYSYVEKAVNISLQAVRNYALRTNYLSKIGAHSKDIFEALKTLDPENVTNVARLAKEANQYNESMQQVMLNHQSPASRNFSKWLKESGTKFEDLVTRYQNKRGFSGLFKNLTDEEKLLVYNDIIVASGRGSVVADTLSTISGVAGILFLILATGVIVWDIFTSEHVLQTVTKDVMVTVATVGGAMVGQVVGAALPTLAGVEASALFLMATAVIGSVVGAFVVGAFVGWLVDHIFSSGGHYPHNTDNHTCYVAPLPDGEAIARQIVHQ